MEEGCWDNTMTSPDTDQNESAKLRFPNPAKFESDFSAIYQFDKNGYSQVVREDEPSRYSQERQSEQPKRRNPRPNFRSSSLDQSTISCYNELNRTYKSNCDFHFSTPGSKSTTKIASPQSVQNYTYQAIQSLEVRNPSLNKTSCPCGVRSPEDLRKGIYIVNTNSYSTDV